MNCSAMSSGVPKFLAVSVSGGNASPGSAGEDLGKRRRTLTRPRRYPKQGQPSLSPVGDLNSGKLLLQVVPLRIQSSTALGLPFSLSPSKGAAYGPQECIGDRRTHSSTDQLPLQPLSPALPRPTSNTLDCHAQAFNPFHTTALSLAFLDKAWP